MERRGTQSAGTEMVFFLLNRFKLIAVTPLICHGGFWLRLSSSYPGHTSGNWAFGGCRDSRITASLASVGRKALTSGGTRLVC